MRVRALSMTSALVLAAAGAVALPAGVAAAADCSANPGFYANNDAIQDTVVGAPFEDIGTAKDAGIVTVVYGTAADSFGSGSLQIQQSDLKGTSQKNDHFGAALATGDVNGDFCYDLVIGDPGEKSSTGLIAVILGSPTGLVMSSAKWYSQNGVAGAAEAGDEFGAALAFSGPNSQYLWIGSPGENIGTVVGAGLVTRVPTGTSGTGQLPTTGSHQYYQGSAGGAGGTAERLDRFGEVLSGSKYSLLVGVPKEDVGTLTDAGVVHVFDGSAWKSFTQDTTAPAIPTAAKGNDRFGQSVAQLASCSGVAGQEAYLAAAPGEDLTGAAQGGNVSIVDYNTGLATSLTQTTSGGTAEPGDNFGRRVVVAGNLVAISAPNEDGSGKAGVNIGAVNQVLMTCTGATPTVQAASQLTLSNSGSSAERGDRFGLALAFSYANGTANGPRLVVGAPTKKDGSVDDSGIVYAFSAKTGGLFVGPAVQMRQSLGTIVGTAEKGDQFGAALSSNAY